MLHRLRPVLRIGRGSGGGVSRNVCWTYSSPSSQLWNANTTMNAAHAPAMPLSTHAKKRHQDAKAGNYGTDVDLFSFSSSPPKPFSFPVSHSRHKLAPIAPLEILDSMSSEILSSPVGSLFSFDKDIDEEENDVAYVTREKLEYVLRGHSAQIHGSVIERTVNKDGNDNKMEDKVSLSVIDRASLMEKLLKRVEEEGEQFQKEAEQARMGLLVPATVDADGETPTVKKSFAPKQRLVDQTAPIPQQRSSPGPSTHMYDLVLDATATVLASSTKDDALALLQCCQDVHDRAMSRHILDGKETNTNEHTFPTPMTYNALIRAASNVPYNAEDDDDSSLSLRIRDNALNMGLLTFDHMYHSDAVERNAPTFRYMLSILRKTIPNCRSRGNIACSIIVKACEEGVFDEHMQRELREDNCGGGKEFDRWIPTIVDPDLKDLPAKWRRHVKPRKCERVPDGMY